jgi:hypothetical protein
MIADYVFNQTQDLILELEDVEEIVLGSTDEMIDKFNEMTHEEKLALVDEVNKMLRSYYL